MRSTRALTTLAAAALAVALPGVGARAQDVEIGRPYRVHDHGVASRHADDFARYSEKGEWALAVRALQNLLDLPPDLGYVVRIEGSTPTLYEGAGRFARRLFDRLPEAGVAAWNAAYGDEAERLLLRGVRLRRAEDLRQAARRFPTRDVLRRAHEALASLALAHGAFGEAAFELRALLEVTDASAERAQVFARLAFARAQAGDRNGTDRVIALSQDLSDETVPGPAGPERLGVFLDRMAGAAGPAATDTTGWPEFGGDRHGTASAEPAPPPGEKYRWRTPTGYEEGDETDSDRPFRWMVREDTSHRPVAPVVSQGIVYLNNGLALRAVDLSTGHLSWQHLGGQRTARWRDNRVAVHSATVSDGVVYAALATRADAPDMEREFYGRTIVYSLPHRALHALDARTGDVLWSHRDDQLEGRADAREVSAESVACPPLVVGDDVVVATWEFNSSFEVRLVCYDRRTGATRWRRSVAQGQQELNLFGRPVKELATSALAELDGTVYLSTGLGVAAAVHLADGEVHWISAYAQEPIPPSNYWYETRERGLTWWPSPTVATHTAVLIAPTDSPYLLAFDPKEGRLIWRFEHDPRPHDHDYFLGVRGRRAYVLGTRLTALDLDSGRPVWRSETAGRFFDDEGGTVSAVGRGVLSKDHVYVPTAETMVEVDAETGEAERMWTIPSAGSQERSGNLVTADGALLVVGRSEVRAHYRFEDLRDRLVARIVRNPTDPRLRLEAGEIFRSAGQLEAAIDSFERGLRLLDDLAPRARDRLEAPLRRALHGALVERAQLSRRAGNLRAGLADLERAVDVTRDRGAAVSALFEIAEIAPAARAEAALRRVLEDFEEVRLTQATGGRVHAGALALFRLGEKAAEANDPGKAVDLWLDLLERHGDADLGGTDVRGAVHGRLQRLAVRSPNVVKSRIRARARRAFDDAQKRGDVEALGRVARLYPDPQVVSEAALLAATLHLESERPRRAVGLLRSLLADPAGPEAEARGLWLLADAYARLGEVAAERIVLQRLLRDTPEARLADGRVAGDAARRRLAEERLSAATRKLPQAVPPLEMLWEASGDEATPQVVLFTGTQPDALAGRLLATRGDVLECLDGRTGEPVWRTPLPLERRAAAGTRDTVVLAGDQRGRGGPSVLVAAFDAATGEPRWTLRLPGAYRAAASGLGVLYLLHAERDPDGTVTHTLSAVELASGQTLAARDFQTALHPEVTVAQDAVVVYESTRRRGAPPRSVTTLDGATLALRGTTGLQEASFNNATLHPDESSVVVTTDRPETLVAVDVTTGREAWRRSLPSREVKALLAVPGAVIASDANGRIHRIDAGSGEIAWSVDLADVGELAWNGEAAAQDTVIATVIPRAEPGRVVTLALDAETGRERWRQTILLKGTGHPHPVVGETAIAYEVNERFRRKAYRSRVLFFDRTTGAPLGSVEHEEIGRRYQRVIHAGELIALTAPGALAVYGPPETAGTPR